MKTYTHLFFDLDHTLWDYERNSTEVLRDLYQEYSLEDRSPYSVEEFITEYQRINHFYWSRLERGEISMEVIRKERFPRTFATIGIHDQQGLSDFPHDFMKRTPHKRHLFPYTLETLEALMNFFELHIITNGFLETQASKLKGNNLRDFFDQVITTDCGYTKPDERVFRYALEKTNCKASDALMIGDSLEADILGAQKVGMDQLFFNPKKKQHKEQPTYEVSCLSEIPSLLL